MGLALNEKNKEERAIEFYHALSTFELSPASTILRYAGTLTPHFASHFTHPIGNTISQIYDTVKENALLAGGHVGNDWSRLSAPLEPFLTVANEIGRAHV